MPLQVAEIFKSIQGESCYAGIPCTFIRLSGCNLRCTYCDTRWAWKEGTTTSLDAIVKKTIALQCGLVEITGGEPLLQPETIPLMKRLLKEERTVLLETNGSLPLNAVPREVIKIVDIKSPGSGEGKSFDTQNLSYLTARDEIKIVVTSKADYGWALKTMKRWKLHEITRVSLSPVSGQKGFARELAEWMTRDTVPARLNLQLHKILWPKTSRGK